jgi:hypothetical protein
LPGALALVGAGLVIFMLVALLVPFSAVPDIIQANDTGLNTRFPEGEVGQEPAVDCGNALESGYSEGSAEELLDFVEEAADPTDPRNQFVDVDALEGAVEACNDERSTRRAVAVMAGVLGVVALASAFVVRRRFRAREGPGPTGA